MFISKETPTGLINGTNTVFTLANNIQDIDDIWIDGAIYLGVYTTDGAEITLSDAPTVSIEIDYWTSNVSGIAGEFITVAEAKNHLMEQLNDNLPELTDSNFLRLINQANNTLWREFKEIMPETFIVEQTYSITPGVYEYDLPSNFHDIASHNCGLFKTDTSGRIYEGPMQYTSVSSTEEGYYLRGNKLYLSRKPNNSYTYIFRYIPQLAKLTADSDLTLIAYEYEEAFTNYLISKFYQWNTQPGEEGLADQRTARALNELLTNYNPEPKVFF